MNSFVERYARGMSAMDRARLDAIWSYLEEVHRLQGDVRGPLPSFGKTAVAFARQMDEIGVRPKPLLPADPGRTSVTYGTSTL